MLTRAIVVVILVVIFSVSSVSAGGAPAFREYSGVGDSVINIEKPDENMAALLMISGNQDRRHFAVLGYDKNGRKTGLFVNTTDKYGGFVLVDMKKTQTSQLEIKASGSWLVKVYHINYMKKYNVPSNIEGKGDSVISITGESKTAGITGNYNQRHFSVKAYSNSGSKLLVNTTDKYSGLVRTGLGPMILEIKAVGEWYIDVE